LQERSSSTDRVDYDDRNWSLGDLGRLKEITKSLRPNVEALHGQAVNQKKKTADLQSQMLKGTNNLDRPLRSEPVARPDILGMYRTAETKKEEAARFVRAKNDPAFAKMIRIRQLGPEQVEYQRKIRLQMEVSSDK
jgi:nucleoporin NUP159